MVTDIDSAKDRLERIAEGLELLAFPSSTLDVDDARWLAQAIRNSLSTGIPLDQALRLKRERGRHSDTRKGALVCQVWAELPNPTADQIAKEVRRRFPNSFKESLDEKQIRRYVGTLSGMAKDFDKLTPTARAALADEVARRMKEGKRRT